MGKFFGFIFILALLAVVYGLLATDSVTDLWFKYYINAHATEHNAEKGDLWVPEQELKAAQYCQVLGNKARCILICKDIVAKYPNTRVAQVAEFRLGQCYDDSMDFIDARDYYQHVYQNYTELGENTWTIKASIRYNEIIAGH